MNHPAMIESMLKELSSEDAAALLMETFPIEASNYSEAFRVMTHRSWKRADQIRLARFYLRKIPFASSKPYEVLASFMSLPILISVVKEALSNKPDDWQLVAYHVIPVLKKNARTEGERSLVDEFLSELNLSPSLADEKAAKTQ